MDFSRVFDKVPHGRMILKLKMDMINSDFIR